MTYKEYCNLGTPSAQKSALEELKFTQVEILEKILLKLEGNNEKLDLKKTSISSELSVEKALENKGISGRKLPSVKKEGIDGRKRKRNIRK